MKSLYVTGESEGMLLLKRRLKTGMAIFGVETEIRILTKQIHTGGPIATDSFDDNLPRRGDDSLETNVRTVMMQASIVMGIGMWYRHGPHQDMD